MPHSNDSLSPHANSNPAIVSGIHKSRTEGSSEGGVDLAELPVGAVLEIETGHTCYRLENMGDGKAMLSGHPAFCPEPVTVQVQGSIGPDGGLKWQFLRTGAHMVFLHPEHGGVRTSPIKGVNRVQAGSPH